jgi:hypothetical protein
MHNFGNPHVLESSKHFCRGSTRLDLGHFCQCPVAIALVDWSGNEPTTLVVFFFRQFAGTPCFRRIAPIQTPIVSVDIEIRLAWDRGSVALVPGQSGTTAALREMNVFRFLSISRINSRWPEILASSWAVFPPKPTARHVRTGSLGFTGAFPL